MKKVTLGVILYGEKYLREVIPTLLAQDYPGLELVLRDQEEGEHRAYKWLKKEMPEAFEKAKITKEKNLWHSGGHNAMMAESKADYYICASNDMLYPEDFVSRMMVAMEENEQFSLAGCKIRQWDFERRVKSEILDSMGIKVTKYQHFKDIGQGEKDQGQYDKLCEVFGISGALMVLRLKDLGKIAEEGKYFDENIHYKNDVDLCYRMQRAGLKAMVVPEVVVYHDRQLAEDHEKSDWAKESSLLGDIVVINKNVDENFGWLMRVAATVYLWLKISYRFLEGPGRVKKVLGKWREIKDETRKKRVALAKGVDVRDFFH